MNILGTSNVGSNFTDSYKKRVPQQEKRNHYSVIKGVLYRPVDGTCFYFESESPFLQND